jgi:methylamine dehydrogenase accessory protein MauD
VHIALLSIRLLVGGVFALASLTKLADLRGSRAAVAGFGVPARFASVLGTLLPVAELGVAAALIPASSARLGALGAVILLGTFVVAIARSIRRGDAPDCHCFGQLSSEPVGRRTLARNAILMGLAAFVAAAGWGNAGPSASAWIGRLGGAGLVAVAAGVAIAGLAAATAWALLALLRQDGALLVRIDELEERLAASGAPPPSSPHHGLPLGEAAPAFSLEGLYGESVTLESLSAADAPVLLLFTDPNCVPCNALMPRISGWQREHSGRLTIAVLTRGSVDENRSKVREHGIGSVWIDAGLEVYSAYRVTGTPGAVLIDSQARIASAVVAGAEAIADLVDAAASAPTFPVLHVPAGREPLPAPVVPPVGAEAPSLDLRDASGEHVPLAVPDGDTLVMFWNPGCGFCQRMLDDLRSFERSPPPSAPRLLFISSGSAGENEAQGLRAPFALDTAFAAGAAFGTTGTPSAILVDRNARVASGLAVGAPQVMALATAPVERGA